MSSWQSHPLDERPAEFMHLGELHELAEDQEGAAIGASGYTVYPSGTVEYECVRCGNWCVRNIEEPCVHHGECLPCYIDGGDAATLLAESEIDAATIPPAVPWTELVEYRCGSCKEWCLNWSGLSCAQAGECRAYHRVPDISDLPPLPPSEGEGAEGTSAAGSSRPEAGPERPEGPAEATDPEAGPLPWGPEPEARAHPRRPKGEGERERSASSGSTGPGGRQ